VNGELTVIYDSGNTRPLAPLLEVFASGMPPIPRPEPHRPTLGAADLDRLLPIQSPGLTPGKVERRQLDRHFAQGETVLVAFLPLARMLPRILVFSRT